MYVFGRSRPGSAYAQLTELSELNILPCAGDLQDHQLDMSTRGSRSSSYQRHDHCVHSGQFMVSSLTDESDTDGKGDTDRDTGQTECNAFDRRCLTITDCVNSNEFGCDVEANGVSGLVNYVDSSVAMEMVAIEHDVTVRISRNMKLFDTQISSLFKCMEAKYSSKLQSPKWNEFKGVKVKIPLKIRLNNLIWREWFKQYRKHDRPFVCRFDTPACDATHSRPEAVVLEGKYWKRTYDSVLMEYQKWRKNYLRPKDADLSIIHEVVRHADQLNCSNSKVLNISQEDSECVAISAADSMDCDLDDVLDDHFFAYFLARPPPMPVVSAPPTEFTPQRVRRTGVSYPSMGPGNNSILTALLQGSRGEIEHRPVSTLDVDCLSLLSQNMSMSRNDPAQQSYASQPDYSSQQNYHLPSMDQNIQTSSSSSFPSHYGTQDTSNASQVTGHRSEVTAQSQCNNIAPRQRSFNHLTVEEGTLWSNTSIGTFADYEHLAQFPAFTHPPTSPSAMRPPMRTRSMLEDLLSTPAKDQQRMTVPVVRRKSHLRRFTAEESEQQRRASTGSLPLQNKLFVKSKSSSCMGSESGANKTTERKRILSVANFLSQGQADDGVNQFGLHGSGQILASEVRQESRRAKYSEGSQRRRSAVERFTYTRNYSTESSAEKSLVIPQEFNFFNQSVSSPPEIRFESIQSELTKRASHISSEQKRRQGINDGFDLLDALNSAATGKPSGRSSRAAILKSSAEICKQFQIERARVKQEQERLRMEVDSLSMELRNLQLQLPASGASTGRSHTETLRQMFVEYVRQRSAENWKYLIFKNLANKLFGSFLHLSSDADRPDWQHNLLNWLDMSCSLPQLRSKLEEVLVDLSINTSVLIDPSNLPGELQMFPLRLPDTPCEMESNEQPWSMSYSQLTDLNSSLMDVNQLNM